MKRDETTGTEISGNKVRKLEYVIAQALAENCDTLVTCGGVQSNHCRATAVLGARLGLKVHLILRGNRPSVADGNLMLDYVAGARITYIPESQWATHEEVATQLQSNYSTSGDKAWVIPVGASDEIGLWGYIAACEELSEDFTQQGINPGYIVTATGSGGTQGGLVLGRELYGLDSEIVAINVCDDADWFERKIRRDLRLWKQRYNSQLDVDALPIRTIEGYVGPGYARAGPEVFDIICRLARAEGLFLDPVYTAKAFHGMVREIESGRLADTDHIVFIHTGGLFGVFPQKQYFEFP